MIMFSVVICRSRRLLGLKQVAFYVANNRANGCTVAKHQPGVGAESCGDCSTPSCFGVDRAPAPTEVRRHAAVNIREGNDVSVVLGPGERW